MQFLGNTGHFKIDLVLITDRVRSTREGYVLTRVCPSIHPSVCPYLGGTSARSRQGWVPQPGPGMSYPDGGTPPWVPHQTWLGDTPTGGVPLLHWTWPGAYPDGVYPTLDTPSVWYPPPPPHRTWMGGNPPWVPPIRPGQGGTPTRGEP